MKINSFAKRLSCFIVAVIFVAMSFNASAANLSQGASFSDQAHIYEVLPGENEWNSMTVGERLDACYVGEEEAANMTTDALVETVLNYPYLINIYAYNSLEEGIAMVSEHFSGLNELLSRTECAQKLQSFLVENHDSHSVNNIDTKQFMAQRLYEYALDTSSNSIDLARAQVGYVYTPKHTRVTASYNLTWADTKLTEQEANAINQSMLKTYPGVSLLRSANPSYNCHSYAWHSTSSSNKYWINDPTAYTTDGSYFSSFSKSPNKITYKQLSDGSIIYSGIVTSSSGKPTVVTSKWGALGLFSHAKANCPYNVDKYGSLSYGYWEAS